MQSFGIQPPLNKKRKHISEEPAIARKVARAVSSEPNSSDDSGEDDNNEDENVDEEEDEDEGLGGLEEEDESEDGAFVHFGAWKWPIYALQIFPIYLLRSSERKLRLKILQVDPCVGHRQK